MTFQRLQSSISHTHVDANILNFVCLRVWVVYIVWYVLYIYMCLCVCVCSAIVCIVLYMCVMYWCACLFGVFVCVHVCMMYLSVVCVCTCYISFWCIVCVCVLSVVYLCVIYLCVYVCMYMVYLYVGIHFSLCVYGACAHVCIHSCVHMYRQGPEQKIRCPALSASNLLPWDSFCSWTWSQVCEQQACLFHTQSWVYKHLHSHAQLFICFLGIQTQVDALVQ